MTPRHALERGIAELALGVPQAACDRLLRYVDLLGKWNRAHNLTAISDPLQAVTHHLLDSLAVVPHLPMTEGAALADAGSGPGMPGIALAIARPAWRVALNDASEKKTAFLRQAAFELELENVSVHSGRVEDWRPRSGFAVVISRAFSELARFVECCRHLVAPAGALAAMKGAYPRAELARLPEGCNCGEVIPLTVPFLDAERHLVLCRVRD